MPTDIASLEGKTLAWLMLARRTDAPEAEFKRDVARETAGLRASAPFGWDVQLRMLVDESGGAETQKPRLFDAIVAIAGPQADFRTHVTKLCAGFAARLGAAVDAAQSGAIAGAPHVVRPGRGRYMNAFCLRPAEGKTLAAAREYWRTTHRQIAEGIKGAAAGSPALPTPSYAQLHADDAASQALAESAGVALTDFFGAALNFVDDVNWIASMKASSSAASAASLDVPNFIDVARSPRAHYDLV